jgi:hypothetical protein
MVFNFYKHYFPTPFLPSLIINISAGTIEGANIYFNEGLRIK